jgi:hypothetical protein
MRKPLKLGLLVGVAAFILPVLLTFALSDFGTTEFALAMLIPLALVLAVYTALKHELENVLNHQFNRRHLFKTGITVSIIVALLHSFGIIANEHVNTEKLFVNREANSLSRIDEANEEMARINGLDLVSDDDKKTMESIEEWLVKETSALERAREHKGEVFLNLKLLGAKTVLLDMLYGVTYSIAIGFLLKMNPKYKRN